MIRIGRLFGRFVIAGGFLLCCCGILAASNDATRLNTAVIVFHEIMGAPDQAIPQELLDRSYCAVIIPV